MIIALVLLLEPKILLSQIQWGVAPTWSQFLYGLAMGTVAYTGIETISNMAEEAQRRTGTCRAPSTSSSSPCSSCTSACRWRRCRR